MTDYGAVYKELLALQREKKWTEAVEKADKCIELKPEAAQPHYAKAFGLFNLKKHDEALISINKALEIDPNYVNAYNLKGNILKDSKKYSEAVTQYQKAIELSPKDSFFYLHLGYCLSAQGKHAEAVKAYNQCSGLNPESVEAYLGEYRSYLALKKEGDAVKVLEGAVNASPKKSQLWDLLGVSQRNQKKIPEALDSFNKGIEGDPNAILCYFHRAGIYSSQQKNQEALSDLKKVFELKDQTTQNENDQATIEQINQALDDNKKEILNYVNQLNEAQDLLNAKAKDTNDEALKENVAKLEKSKHENVDKAIKIIVSDKPASKDSCLKLLRDSDNLRKEYEKLGAPVGQATLKDTSTLDKKGADPNGHRTACCNIY